MWRCCNVDKEGILNAKFVGMRMETAVVIVLFQHLHSETKEKHGIPESKFPVVKPWFPEYEMGILVSTFCKFLSLLSGIQVGRVVCLPHTEGTYRSEIHTSIDMHSSFDKLCALAGRYKRNKRGRKNSFWFADYWKKKRHTAQRSIFKTLLFTRNAEQYIVVFHITFLMRYCLGHGQQ